MVFFFKKQIIPKSQTPLGVTCFLFDIIFSSTEKIPQKNQTPNDLGVSLNGDTPKTPQNDHFSRKTHGCWGNPPF